MANSMKTLARKCFPKAIKVTDCFHVQQLSFIPFLLHIINRTQVKRFVL
ncbi:transposase [Zunongwangia sp. F260]|uniref:Transposase n=1 Tax=Autumnicola lenta TaxID=3075593 RepID=A0ABU3CGQ1_9FLAO|nr:transposase [Zunongwangia sp. F260]MDT0645530.1 transposase [Zunongwangia sp. F260]